MVSGCPRDPYDNVGKIFASNGSADWERLAEPFVSSGIFSQNGVTFESSH